MLLFLYTIYEGWRVALLLILQTALGLDQVQNTDKGIRTGNTPIRNVHISFTVYSMEHKNRRLWGLTSTDSCLVPKFPLIDGGFSPWNVFKVWMCSNPSGWSLVVVLHPSLIIGTAGWQTGPCNELSPLWQPSPAFLSLPVIQVLPELGLILPLLVFLIGKESPQCL